MLGTIIGSTIACAIAVYLAYSLFPKQLGGVFTSLRANVDAALMVAAEGEPAVFELTPEQKDRARTLARTEAPRWLDVRERITLRERIIHVDCYACGGNVQASSAVTDVNLVRGIALLDHWRCGMGLPRSAWRKQPTVDA